MRTNRLSEKGNGMLVLLAIAGLSAGCASTQQKGMAMNTMAVTKDVEITFDTSGCPVSVSPNTPIEITRANGDMVKWQAVDGSGGTLNIDFDIYFDPFKGKSLNSNAQGWVQSTPVDPNTPVNVEFKYTIVGSACPTSPLDPRIKIL